MNHDIVLETYADLGIREIGTAMLMATVREFDGGLYASIFAKELVGRWNAYLKLLSAIKKSYDLLNNHCSVSETYAEEMQLVMAELKEAMEKNHA